MFHTLFHLELAILLKIGLLQILKLQKQIVMIWGQSVYRCLVLRLNCIMIGRMIQWQFHLGKILGASAGKIQAVKKKSEIGSVVKYRITPPSLKPNYIWKLKMKWDVWRIKLKRGKSEGLEIRIGYWIILCLEEEYIWGGEQNRSWHSRSLGVLE